MVEREWVLLNPGPANTSLSVKQALVTPDLCHREPEFFEVMRECRERLVRVVGCRDTYAFRVSNMGTLTPADMKGVVDAFAASLEELGVMTSSTPSLHRP